MSFPINTILFILSPQASSQTFCISGLYFSILSISYLGAAAIHCPASEIVLCLLDVNLPDQNGFSLFRQIRTFSKVPIIFLTADDIETSIVMGLDMGADDYITKPFKASQ